jgi:hypothetical protein
LEEGGSMILYPNVMYANNRLVGTIILYKGVPVTINDLLPDINGEGVVYFTYLKDGKKGQAKYNQDFDLTPVPLGYTNYNGISLYLSRIPMRKDWKQGLRTATTRCLVNGQVYEGQVPFSELYKTIAGDYPSIKKAIEHVQLPQISSMSFNRAFAIDKALNIWHKGRSQIGKIINPKTHEYSLKDEFFWARETLEAAL